MRRAGGRLVAAGIGAAVATSLLTWTILAATSTATVTPSSAEPGDAITVEIHVFGGPISGTDLYLVPTDNAADGPHCSDMTGSVLVGTVAWTDNGLDHDGVAHFTLPAVPGGDYVLLIELGNVIPPCFPAGSLEVRGGEGPDTAMGRPAMPLGVWLMVAGLGLFGVAAWARRRAKSKEEAGEGWR
jgi:hypothetical protein